MMQNLKSPLIPFLFLLFFALPIFAQSSDSLTLCSSGNGQSLSSSAATGVFYDSGGPQSYYNNYESCALLIDPGCAESITITVHEYNTENCCDGLYFFDGMDDTAPLLLNMQYAIAPQTMTFPSGKVFVKWVSDGSVVGYGFRVTWSSELVSPTPPEIDVFSASTTDPALQETVQFTASGTNYPQQWLWDFGDGSSSNEQNPSHNFSIPGPDTVRLIVINCYGLSDTAELALEIQEPPAVVADPNTFEVTLDCGSSLEKIVNLINNGQGDLHFQVSGANTSGKIRPLIYTYTAFYYSTDGIASELAPYAASYDIQYSAETDSAAFAHQLADRDILIFPDIPPSLESFTVLNGLRGAILDFVAAGGSLIFCGQEYGGNVLPLTGLLSADFSDNPNISGNYIEFPVNHPILANLPSGIYTLNASLALNFTNQDYVSLASFNGYSWLGYREVGNAKVIYLGSNFNQHDWTQGLLLHNSMQWCGSRGYFPVTPSTGVVAPGDTLPLSVQFSAAGLYSGDYTGTIDLTTNDPLQPLLTLPYTMHVEGMAALETSVNALDFGSLQQFSQAAQSVVVNNTGCDTLVVQSITVSSAAYSISPQQLTVLPFSSDTISVTFAPQDTGWQSGYLVLQSNVAIDSLSLAGYAVGAPIITVSPQSLSATLTCGDSIALPLTITNTGLGELNLEVSGAIGIGQSPLKILMMYAGTYDNYFYFGVEQSIFERFPNAQLTRFDIQDISQLPSLLVDKNLVVVPFVGYADPSFYAQLGQAIQPFVHAGGGIIFTGTFVWPNLNAYGFMQIAEDGIDASGFPMEAIVPQHPILQGIDLQIPVYDNFYGSIFSSPNFEPLAKVSGYPHTAVGVEPFGAGKSVYLAPVFVNATARDLDLLENAINWCARPTWLSTSPGTVTIPAGGSTTIQVNFNAAGLLENTFSSNLTLSTNDPQHPTLDVPCTMIVDGEPQLVGLQSNLNFGILQQFSQKELSIDFGNTGCDTLNILSATTNNPVFQVLNFDALTLSNGVGKVRLRFAPLLPGNLSAILTLVTDGGTFTVTLQGIAVGAPIAVVNPASLTVNLACDESLTLPITLNNTGLGSMNYQVGNLQSPRNVLAITYGASSYRWNNIRPFLLQHVPNVSLSEYAGNLAAQLADSIAQKRVDVLIVPPMDIDNDPAFAAFKPVIQNFLQHGGQVLAMGAYRPESLEQLGLFDLIGTNYSYYPIAHVTDKVHRLTSGIEENHQVNDNCYLASFPFGEVHSVALSPNEQHVYLGYRNVGQGNVVYWSQIFDYVDPTAAPILKNVFAWFSNPLPSGVGLAAVSGIIPVGGSVNMPVVFSGAQLPGGQYQGQIHLYTNDPMHNPLVVPITLNMSFKPCTDFTTLGSPCSGLVAFKDKTLNNATSWYWEFGDNGTSFGQNPAHTYTGVGNYAVSLVSCNNFGCDTLTQSVEILALEGPKIANCNPQSINPCCDAGIFKVQVGLLDHSSGNAASEGYKDFSCTEGTELMAGIQFPLTVITGNQNAEYVRGWIDLNNNGVFSDNEQIINDEAFPLHHAFFTPPINAVKDVSLRMRIMSEPVSANPITTPCSDLYYGQCEDYYVVIRTTVSTSEPGEEMTTRVYPNPSAGETWLEFNLPESQSVQLRIADQMGRIVWEHKIENASAGLNNLALPQLPAGAYALAVQSGATTKIEKIVRVDQP